MAIVLHPRAYYRDSENIIREIKAEDLGDSRVLELARLNELTDKYGQIRLYPRTPDGCAPHFYTKGDQGPRVFDSERGDPVHDARVESLRAQLASMDDSWTLCFKPTRDSIETELKLPGYNWDSEVTRGVDVDTVVRHDVFGAEPSLSTSRLRPAVAIEVVHTHYPDEQAFAGMLSHSARVPYAIFFDHTRRPNTFIKVDVRSQQLIYQRWTYHIHDGQVWHGREPASILTSAALRIALEGQIDSWDRLGRSSQVRTT